jgi:hypothetical protein
LDTSDIGPSTYGADLAEMDWSFALQRAVVGRLEPACLSGEQCQSLVEVMGRIERLMASGIALLSPRVIESGSYAKSGHASAPDWLSSVAGTSAGAAKDRLAAGERAAGDPRLSAALRQGKLSAPELGVVTKAAATDPGAVETLLDLVEGEASHQELHQAAARMKAAARSKETERATRARIHANRHFRWRRDDEGGIRAEIFCDEVDWARVSPILEADTKARWKAAGSGAGESFEAHRLDAFIDLLGRVRGDGSADGGSRGGGSRGGARPEVIVLIDAEALRRGTTSTGEICEIEGIGPVPVESATELLGEGSLRFIIKEGTDIRTVTRSSRDLARRTAAALLARDRACVVPGCGKRLGLQGDHCFVDYAKDGPTELANLALLCPAHHDMKTHGGWKITGGPGHWHWIAPPKPPDAGAIARTKKVAVAKAKGRAQRNGPQRT